MTDNHGYETPSKGSTDWHIPLNDNFRRIDTDVEIRDVKANRAQYQPKVDSKFLATDVGRVYLGDGQQWQEIGSLVTDSVDVKRVNNVLYADQYPGADLTEKVQAAIDDLPGGNGKVIVPPKADGGTWEWSTWQIDPTDYGGIHIEFVGDGEVRYDGNGYAVTVDSNGDISTQIRGASFKITGGQWQATGDPAGFVRVVDVIRGHFEPELVKGFFNSSGDCTVYSVETATKWSENNYFSGIVTVCDIGMEFIPNGRTSFVDCKVDDFSVGAKKCGIILRGNLSGIEFSNYVFFPRSDGAVGVELDDWNLNGAQFNSPRFDNVDDRDNTVAFASTNNYSAPGPMIFNPIMPTLAKPYDAAESGGALYALRPVNGEFHIDNLHPDGGTMVFNHRGQFELFDSDANPVYRLHNNGAVMVGGNYNTGEPPVFNDNLKLNMEDLTKREPRYKEIAFHDGSNGHSTSLCFYAGSTWYNVVDGAMM